MKTVITVLKGILDFFYIPLVSVLFVLTYFSSRRWFAILLGVILAVLSTVGSFIGIIIPEFEHWIVFSLLSFCLLIISIVTIMDNIKNKNVDKVV